MLREAVRAGLVLNPAGVALQTALLIPAPSDPLVPGPSVGAQTEHGIASSTWAAGEGTVNQDDSPLHALHRLAKLLNDQVDDVKKDLENWAKCQPLITHIGQDVLTQIVEEAARLDSCPIGTNEQVIAPGGANGQWPERTFRRSADAECDYTESLVRPWTVLEGVKLTTRKYTPNGLEEKNVKR
jgi:hypothetical protein